MTEIKAHEFDLFVRKRVKDFRIFLIYGPDRGLVSERAQKIATVSGVDLSDPFSFVRLDTADFAGNAGRLVEEALSQGLFGGDKLIWVKGAGADKAVSDAISFLGNDRGLENTWIIVESGDLKKGTQLRKAAETSAGVVAIPSYADDTKSLNVLIDEELGSADLKISTEAREILLENLGGDRLASRGELRKLVLYCQKQKLINTEDVLAIIGDASSISTDDAIDAVLRGDRESLYHAMQKVTSSKSPVFLVLQGVLKMYQLLDFMRNEMEEKRSTPSEVVSTYGRHLHFKRKPLVETALRNFGSDMLARELARLQASVLMTRKNNSLEDAIALQTLLGTAISAERTLMRARA